MMALGPQRLLMAGGGGVALPTLWAHWDASDSSTITHSSNAVSQWNDKSGNGRHLTQATGSRQPTTNTRTLNGLNVLDFDGTDDWMRVTGVSLGMTNVTVFFVCEQDVNASGPTGMMSAYNSGNSNDYDTVNAFAMSTAGTSYVIDYFQDYNGTNGFTRVAGTGSPPTAVWAARKTSATVVTLWKNGVQQSTEGIARFATGTANAVLVGSRWQSSSPASEFLNGTVAEIRIYASALTDTEMGAVYADMSKWGL